MTQYTYSFSYQRRDFTPQLRLLMERQPRITSLFRMGEAVTNNTFYYYDQIDQPVTATINHGGGYAAGTSSFVVDGEVGTLSAGDLITFKDSSYEVLTVDSYTAGTHTLVTTGNSAYDHANDVVILRVSTPRQQGTSASASNIETGTQRTNYTQIFRRDIKVAGSKLMIYDEDHNDSIMERGAVEQFNKIYRDLAMTLIYGTPLVSSSGVAGKTAGLLYWLTQSSAMKYDKSAAALTAAHINDAVEDVVNKGSSPDYIVCNTATARKISAFNTSTTNSMVVISSDSNVGGGVRAVTQFTGDLPGEGLKAILVEPNIPNGVLMILSSEYLELCPLNDRSFSDYDSTDNDFDGAQRTILGEYGTKIHNPYYSHALIYNFT